MATPPAEVELSLVEVRALIEARLPTLASAHLTLLDQGWDNVVFEATLDAVPTQTWVVRLPRRAFAVRLLHRELRVLNWLAEMATTPLPLPRPAAVASTPIDTEEVSLYPWPFWAAPKLAGRELADLALPDGYQVGRDQLGRQQSGQQSGRQQLAVAMGEFLRWLHAQQPPFPLPFDPNARCDAHSRAGHLDSAIKDLASQGISLPDGLPELVAHAQALPRENADERAGRASRSGVVLCHGDLHLRHVLVEDDLAPTGIIDWGDVCLADPVLDLSFGYAAFEVTDRRAFFGAYGHSLSADDEVRARILAANLCALLALSALENGSARVGEYLQGLRRSLA